MLPLTLRDRLLLGARECAGNAGFGTCTVTHKRHVRLESCRNCGAKRFSDSFMVLNLSPLRFHSSLSTLAASHIRVHEVSHLVDCIIWLVQILSSGMNLGACSNETTLNTTLRQTDLNGPAVYDTLELVECESYILRFRTLLIPRTTPMSGVRHTRTSETTMSAHVRQTRQRD